jgi:hypothetical protein
MWILTALCTAASIFLFIALIRFLFSKSYRKKIWSRMPKVKLPKITFGKKNDNGAESTETDHEKVSVWEKFLNALLAVLL